MIWAASVLGFPFEGHGDAGDPVSPHPPAFSAPGVTVGWGSRRLHCRSGGAALAGSHAPPPVISARPGSQHFPLEISPDPISLGTLRPGESSFASLRLRNAGDTLLTVSRIATSCPCVSIEPLPTSVAPRQVVKLTVHVDRESDPEFESPLEVEVTGYLTDETVAFRASVRFQAGRALDREESCSWPR